MTMILILFLVQFSHASEDHCPQKEVIAELFKGVLCGSTIPGFKPECELTLKYTKSFPIHDDDDRSTNYCSLDSFSEARITKVDPPDELGGMTVHFNVKLKKPCDGSTHLTDSFVVAWNSKKKIDQAGCAYISSLPDHNYLVKKGAY